MVKQYYYKAKTDGWAINAKAFKDATKDKPAILQIGSFEKIEGLQAVPVKKGDRLPTNTNGIIDKKTVDGGEAGHARREYPESNCSKPNQGSQGVQIQGYLQA